MGRGRGDIGGGPPNPISCMIREGVSKTCLLIVLSLMDP